MKSPEDKNHQERLLHLMIIIAKSCKKRNQRDKNQIKMLEEKVLLTEVLFYLILGSCEMSDELMYDICKIQGLNSLIK